MELWIWLPVTFVWSAWRAWVSVTYSCLDARRSKETSVIYLTALVAAFTFAYLLTAMIRPERF